MLDECRVLINVQPGNKYAASGLKIKEKRQSIHEIFLMPHPRMGEEKKRIISKKSYSVTTSIITKKHTKYAILDHSIRVRK
jgi:hypothetical protein